MLKSIKLFQIAFGRSISVTYVVHALLTVFWIVLCYMCDGLLRLQTFA